MAHDAAGGRKRLRRQAPVIVVAGPESRRTGDADPRARRDFGLRGGGPPNVVSEEVLLRLPFADLREFRRAGAPDAAPVLVVPPMAGGFPVLLYDLVAGLLAARGQVAVADWFDARYVPAGQGGFTLADNIGAVRSMLERLGPETHVVAVCQGAVPALAATASLAAAAAPAAPRSLVLAGGPIDTLVKPTRAALFARSHALDWFDEHVISTIPAGEPGSGRLVYPGTLQFQTFMAYAARHMVEQRELFWKFMADDGLDPMGHPFFRLALGMMDLTREFFLDSIRHVFQEPMFLAAADPPAWPGLDLRALDRTALLTVEGEEDDLCSPGQTEAAHRLCARIPDAWRARLLVPGSGHFSLFHGRPCRESVIPALLRFWAGLPAPQSGLSQRKDATSRRIKLRPSGSRTRTPAGGKP
jgi:poly(3-hydroxybutyrate) depolymerase